MPTMKHPKTKGVYEASPSQVRLLERSGWVVDGENPKPLPPSDGTPPLVDGPGNRDPELRDKARAAVKKES